MSERFEQAALDRFHEQESTRGVPQGSSAGGFVPTTMEGDPGLHRYLHSHGRSLKRNIFGTGKLEVDKRACPGCMFPDAPEGKWPHVQDTRCERFRFAAKLVRRIIEGARPVDCPKHTLEELRIDPSTLPSTLWKTEGQLS